MYKEGLIFPTRTVLDCSSPPLGLGIQLIDFPPSIPRPCPFFITTSQDLSVMATNTAYGPMFQTLANRFKQHEQASNVRAHAQVVDRQCKPTLHASSSASSTTNSEASDAPQNRSAQHKRSAK